MSNESIHIGDIIAGKYRVEGALGRGGMGMVVACTDLELDDRVAVKLLLPELVSNEAFNARLLIEARAVRKLRSEHVARVLHVGMLAETNAPYMVMELLEGKDLSRLVRANGPLQPDLAVACILQSLEAVAEAHRKGIIHRDLKPANLFLTHRVDGQPLIKVLDFGIAKVASETLATGEAHVIPDLIGTASYSSPEQRTACSPIDVRADIWSLGVTLFKLLTGELPFEKQAAPEDGAQMVPVAPRQLRDFVPDIDPGLQGVIDKCLQWDPDARYVDVADLAAGLAPFAPEFVRGYPERIERTLDASGELTGSKPQARANFVGAPTEQSLGAPSEPPPGSLLVSRSRPRDSLGHPQEESHDPVADDIATPELVATSPTIRPSYDDHPSRVTGDWFDHDAASGPHRSRRSLVALLVAAGVLVVLFGLVASISRARAWHSDLSPLSRELAARVASGSALADNALPTGQPSSSLSTMSSASGSNLAHPGRTMGSWSGPIHSLYHPMLPPMTPLTQPSSQGSTQVPPLQGASPVGNSKLRVVN